MNTGWENFETFRVPTGDRGAASGTLWTKEHVAPYVGGSPDAPCFYELRRRVKLAWQVLRGEDEWSNS